MNKTKNRLKNLTAGVATAAVVAAGGHALVDPGPDEFSGIVRATSPGNWTLINDPNHAVVGLENPRCVGNDLVVDFPASAQVVGATVTMDEVYAPLGYTVGPSVGLALVKLRFGKLGAPVACNSPMLVHPSANVFITVEMVPLS